MRKILDIPLNNKALVFGTNLGADILGISSSILFKDTQAQIDAILAFNDFFNPDFLLTPMDLSVEAEYFGSSVRFLESDAPTVTNRLIQSIDEIKKISTPHPESKRIKAFLTAAESIKSLHIGKPLISGATGPFTLAGRLFGEQELFRLIFLDPSAAEALIDKCLRFIHDFAEAFKQAGCDGIVISEPLAGMLSPKDMKRFSSRFIRDLVKELESPEFFVIIHNCGAKIVHADAILHAGASTFHFGAPMDIVQILEKCNGAPVVSGNLDPVAIFMGGTPESVFTETRSLMKRANSHRNFLISSGCDLPRNTPPENVHAFYSAVRQELP